MDKLDLINNKIEMVYCELKELRKESIEGGRCLVAIRTKVKIHSGILAAVGAALLGGLAKLFFM